MKSLNQNTINPNINPYGVMNSQIGSNQFYWTNGRAMVDAWPIANNGQVIFIDPEAMKLYIKKADQYGRPYEPEVYSLTLEQAETPVSEDVVTSAIKDMDLDRIINERVEKAIADKLTSMFKKTEE